MPILKLEKPVQLIHGNTICSTKRLKIKNQMVKNSTGQGQWSDKAHGNLLSQLLLRVGQWTNPTSPIVWGMAQHVPMISQ